MTAAGALIGAAADRVAIVDELERRLPRYGDRPLLRCGGETVTFGEVFDRVRRCAAGLVELGVKPGERALLIAENSVAAVVSWLAIGATGAIDVPLNVDARGRFLGERARDAEASAVIGTSAQLAKLAEVFDEFEGPVVDLEGEPARRIFPRSRVEVGFDQLAGDPAALSHRPRTGDLATIMFTSGTTGRSKGVMLPHGYYPGFGALGDPRGATEGTTLYCTQPMYHSDGRILFCHQLLTGGTLVLARRFSVGRFWDEIRESNADSFSFIGAMLWLLYKQEPAANDSDNPAEWGLGSSVPTEIAAAFEQRFGVGLLDGYGMTEANPISLSRPTARKLGAVGRPIDPVEVRIVDENGEEVEAGVTGELTFRPRLPNLATLGYWRHPEATAEAFRDLWFHTGDLLSRDEDGYLRYHGRLKDSIRHRGENVAAWEVEQACNAHPFVLEAAAVGVPASSSGDEDVAVLAVLVEGAELTEAELCRFVAADLPRFAVPRFIKFVESLPKTPTQRIEKTAVREQGLVAEAWDRRAQE